MSWLPSTFSVVISTFASSFFSSLMSSVCRLFDEFNVEFFVDFFLNFFPRCMSTALNRLVDQSSRVVTALLKEYHNLWIPRSRQQSFVKDTTDFISFI